MQQLRQRCHVKRRGPAVPGEQPVGAQRVSISSTSEDYLGRYISDEFYGGRLRSDASSTARDTPLGTGLRFCPVEHDGCRQESRAEAESRRG
jgi:hypothetical protein